MDRPHPAITDTGGTARQLLVFAESDTFGDALIKLPVVEEPGGAEAGPLLTIALAQRLSAGVANDSGTGHMLAAGGRPLVSLSGPTDPDKFAPQARRLTLIHAREFGAERMDAIPEQAVREALDGLLVS
ncbi:MAG: glycosyltransferase family 9 protein [Gammaproteobacteria bacterium]